MQKAWFEDSLEKINTDLQKVRRNIQETKFAVILGKAWFDEFDSREDNTLVVGDALYTFNVREVEVNI